LSLADKTTFLGTPMYMSPEQITPHQTVDPRSDVWSLGCVLHELISGQPAFAAEHLAQVCHKVVYGQAARLTIAASDPVLEGVQRVIDRCLAKDPDDRYADVAELAQDLASLSDAESQVHSHRASSLLKCGLLPPPSSRKPEVLVPASPSVNNPTWGEVAPADEPFGARVLEKHRPGNLWTRVRSGVVMTLALILGSIAAFVVMARQQQRATTTDSAARPEVIANFAPGGSLAASPLLHDGLGPHQPPAMQTLQSRPQPDEAKPSHVASASSLSKSATKLRKATRVPVPGVAVPRLTDESKIRLLQ
jgi:serine/threonine protein kinase